MAFSSSILFTILKTKLAKPYPKCTVGRYVEPKPTQFPYLDFSVPDRAGGNYDLDGNEGSETPLITLEVYNNGSSADTACESISMEAKKIMLSYGFQCKFGPARIPNSDSGICRWSARYQRTFGSGDKL